MKSQSIIFAMIVGGLLLASTTVKAQDCIVTVSGKTIHAHVKKIRSDEISYRKFVRKHEISRDKVLYIVDENGNKNVINDVTMAKHYKNYSQAAAAKPQPKSDSLMHTGNAVQFHPHYIERIGDRFRIDSNTIIGIHQLNSIVAQSPNPAVGLQLKAARTMHTFTMISKITSYPSSAGGAFASYQTFTTLFNMMKAGPVPFKTYLNAGLSFMATISVPITSGILKHIQNKLYDKTLVAYSMGF